jgi:hypothetical protein
MTKIIISFTKNVPGSLNKRDPVWQFHDQLQAELLLLAARRRPLALRRLRRRLHPPGTRGAVGGGFATDHLAFVVVNDLFDNDVVVVVVVIVIVIVENKVFVEAFDRLPELGVGSDLEKKQEGSRRPLFSRNMILVSHDTIFK